MLADPGLDRRRARDRPRPVPASAARTRPPRDRSPRAGADGPTRKAPRATTSPSASTARMARRSGDSTVRAMSRAASVGSTSPVALLRYQARISAIAAASRTIDSATPSATATSARRRLGATRIATAASATTTNGSGVAARSRMRTLRCALWSCSDWTSVNVDETSGMLLARESPDPPAGPGPATRPRRGRASRPPSSTDRAPRLSPVRTATTAACARRLASSHKVGELVRPHELLHVVADERLDLIGQRRRQPRDHLRRPQLGEAVDARPRPPTRRRAG